MESDPKAVRARSDTAAAKIRSLVLRSGTGADNKRPPSPIRIYSHDVRLAEIPLPDDLVQWMRRRRRFLQPKECVNIVRTGKVSEDVAADIDHHKSEEGLKILLLFENRLCGNNQGENKATADSNSAPTVEERPEACHISNSPDRYCPLPTAEGFATSIDAKLQAKRVSVKCWACVNFSYLRGEKLLRVLHSLVRTCVNIGMDISLDPTMLVLDPSPTDIEDSLINVQMFFDHHYTKTVQAKFLLVILPDGKMVDGIEDFCEDIGVVYQCLPLCRMTKEKYLKDAANEIKAKVMERNILSDSHKDLNRDEMAEYYGYNYEEMEEDVYNCKEMGEDDGYNYKGMESVQLCSSNNESGVYTSEEKNPKARDISCSPDREESEQQLLPDEDFTTITDATPQAKSANRKPWVCLNFSRINGVESLRFLSDLGNACMSIGMGLSPEPIMLFKISTFRDDDVAASLWTVFKFLEFVETEKGDNLVLVIMPEAVYCHEKVERMCKNLGFLCQFCLPWHVRMVEKIYLKYTADDMKMKTKVGQNNAPKDKEIGDDGSQRSSEDSDAQIGSKSHWLSGNGTKGETAVACR